MTPSDPNTMLSPEDRDALTLAAQATRRRNRPASAAVLGAAALGVGLIVLAWGVASSRASHAALRNARGSLASMQRLVAELEALRERDLGTSRAELTPIGDIELRIRDLARAREVETSPPSRTNNPIRGTDLRSVRIRYTVESKRFEPVLLWVEDTLEQIPGTRIGLLDISVEGASWDVEVMFERYEQEGTS